MDNHAWESNNETGNNVIEALDSVNELETNLDQSKESMYKLSYVIRVAADTLEELKNEPMIAIKPEMSQGAYDHIVQLCEIHGFIPEQIHYATSIQNLLLMVESGLGFSVLDDNCISSTNVSVRSIPIYKSDPLILVAVWKRDNFNPVIPLFTSLLTADPENTVS